MTAMASLESALPPGAVSTEPEELVQVAIDWWPLLVVQRSRGVSHELPRAVVRPTSTKEVSTVLAWASESATAVVPRGLGSGVCGGAMAVEGSIVLDLSRMNRVLSLDLESQVVEVEAGIRGDALEGELEAHGLTLGHYPQSAEISTVGGWISTTSAGQATPGYGAIEDRVLGLTGVLADGSVIRTRPFPRSAAGPDLKRLVIGAEGTLVVVTEALIGCETRSSGFTWAACRLPDFGSCLACAREWRRARLGASVIRGYDPEDAAHAFAALGHESGCVAFVGFDLDAPGLDERKAAAASIAAGHGGSGLPEEFGERWWNHRLDAVDLFRRVLGPDRELGAQVILDTIDVAALWSRLPGIYQSMREAFAAHHVPARCHFSHVYPSGAALYFTFFVHGDDPTDAERQYADLWPDLASACLNGGGTLTHHHGMGRLKSAYSEQELGSSVELLRRVKRALDPTGVLNPGALLPRSAGDSHRAPQPAP